MSERKAIIDRSSGAVVNVVIIDTDPPVVDEYVGGDPPAPWQPPDGCDAITDDGSAEIGGHYRNGQFEPPARPEVTAADVNRERDRRAAMPFSFRGKMFQARIEDQKRINGAGTLAVAAIVAGAKPGDLRWHGGAVDFAWIASDNTLVTMDAHEVLAFGQAAARWESAHVFAARALKDATPIPTDFQDDGYWPRAG